MSMDIFSVNPSSFKMNKNSTFASKLKASILQKLNHTLVEYSDDVLAEYIVVLICNGKNQHQARYDLEAFLGESSKDFVSWLWNLLLESVDRLRKHTRTSYLEDDYYGNSGGGDGAVENKHRRSTMRGDSVLSEDEKEYCPTMRDTTHPVSSSDRSRGSQCYSVKSNVSLKEIDDKVVKHGCSKKSEPPEGTLNYESSEESESSDDASDTERSTSYESDDEIVRNNNADLPRQPLRVRKDEKPSIISKLNTGENHKFGPSPNINVAEKRSSSRPIDSVSHPNARPRGSVWDRLSRPPVSDRSVRDKSIEPHGGHLVKRTVGNVGQPYEHNRMMHFVPDCRMIGEVPARDNRPVTAISRNSFVDENRRREQDLNRMWVSHHVNTMNRKREFAAISVEEGRYRHQQYTEPPLKQLQRSPSSKSTRSDVLNNFSFGTRQTEPPFAGQALGSSVSACIPDVKVGPQRKSCGEATDAGKTDLKPVKSQLLDMKLRLQQIEMEMTKIKEKAPDNNEDTSKFLSSSGDLKQSDDMEWRTLFVTNVHFAATKEALSLHFVECGAIVKVVILTDVVTLKPKGAAYIIFAEKESADKALALMSGTSFWSMPLKVARKAEMRASVIPPQVTEKPCWPQPYFARPYVGSLQWRREQPVSAETTEKNESGKKEGECNEQKGIGNIEGCSKKSEPAEETFNYESSEESESSDDTFDTERSTSYENDDKIVRNNNADLPRQPLSVRKDERLTMSKLNTGDNHKYGPSPKINVAEKRSSSRHIDSESHPNAKPHVSVWNRLSRPLVSDRSVRDKSIEPHGGHLVKSTVGNVGEPYDRNRMLHFAPGCRMTGEVPALEHRSVTAISRTSFVNENRRREQDDLNRMWIPHHVNTMNRKKEFAAISVEEGRHRHQQYTEPPLKQLQRSRSSKSTRSDFLNNFSFETRETEPLLALGSSVRAFISDVNVGPQRKSCGEATDARKTDLKPVNSQLLDMKLRLHQVEMEMSKIKEKAPNNSENTSKFLSSSGDLKQSDNDVESRTLFVTNVHFAATKEALSLHFVKCGEIVKVVILIDAVTLKPKGAAYITFAKKKSADKALALSGTSFWFRPLKVVRKAEMHASMIHPHVTGKPCWSLQWPPDKSVSAGNGTTDGIIPLRNGFIYFTDGRTLVGDDVRYSDTEKWVHLTNEISMIHGGNHISSMDVVKMLKNLPPMSIERYAKKAKKLYRSLSDNQSHAYIFGRDDTGVRVWYTDSARDWEENDGSPYYCIGGDDYAEEKLDELFLPIDGRPSKEEAIHIAEITLLHTCLNARCTGGQLIVQYLPHDQENENSECIYTTDLELYLKHFLYFEESNMKSLLVLVPANLGKESYDLQKDFGLLYFGIQEDEKEMLKELMYVDWFYHPGAVYKIFRVTFGSVGDCMRVYEDDRLDCRLDSEYDDEYPNYFKRVKLIDQSIIGVGKCEYDALVSYYIFSI